MGTPALIILLIGSIVIGTNGQSKLGGIMTAQNKREHAHRLHIAVSVQKPQRAIRRPHNRSQCDGGRA